MSRQLISKYLNQTGDIWRRDSEKSNDSLMYNSESGQNRWWWFTFDSYNVSFCNNTHRQKCFCLAVFLKKMVASRLQMLEHSLELQSVACQPLVAIPTTFNHSDMTVRSWTPNVNMILHEISRRLRSLKMFFCLSIEQPRLSFNRGQVQQWKPLI